MIYSITWTGANCTYPKLVDQSNNKSTMTYFKKTFGPTDKTLPKSTSEKGIDLARYQNIPWMIDLRLGNVMICLPAGFMPASSLPTDLGRELRPAIEIAQRLNAIKALVLWLMVPEDQLADDRILQSILNFTKRELMES